MNLNAQVMVHVIAKLANVCAKVNGMDIHAPSRSAQDTLKHTKQIIMNCPAQKQRPSPALATIRVGVKRVATATH